MALSKKMIQTLFEDLNNELAILDTKADLFVIGGTAMVMAYDARPSTKDIDGIWQPSEPIRKIIKLLSEKYDIDADWLNDAAKGLMPNVQDENPVVIFDGSYISVSAPSPQYLLATKILASRLDRDEVDIELLVKLCEITNVDQCIAIVDKYYPGRPLQARSKFMVEVIISDLQN